MKIKEVLYLPSGRIFLLETKDKFLVEATEMRDVITNSKEHEEVRNSTDPHVIWKHLRDYEQKWLLTVSTQKGCPHKCEFCDVASLGFKGNLTADEIMEQIKILLDNTPYVQYSEKVKIGFARMGEPSHNLDNVIKAMKSLYLLSSGRSLNWLPCFNSILPRKTLEGLSGFEVLDKILDLKEYRFGGNLHLQISCNSTNEQQRKELFGGADVLTLPEIITHINENAINITKRTITLNFIVMQGIEVDVRKLVKLGLSGDNYTVKLIPLNKTIRGQAKRLKTYANYENYETLVELGAKFRRAGIPTVVDSIAKCEEAGLCCGQLAQIYQ